MTFSVRTQVLGCLFRTMVARLSAGGLVKLDFQINRFFFFLRISMSRSNIWDILTPKYDLLFI